MDLSGFLFPNWTPAQRTELNQRASRLATAMNFTRNRMKARIEQLEGDVGRVALLAKALADVCVRKGLITHDELAAMIAEVDASDGASDGRLDLKALRPPEKGQSSGPRSKG
jgi:hypothetical protein